MKTLTVQEATKLAKANQTPAISLYLATDIPGKDGPIKMRHNLQKLYKKAESLIVRTYAPNTRERLLLPLKKMLSMIGLSRAKGGIGIFHNEHFSGLVKLPTITSDLAVAAESFHIKPVLRCAHLRSNYYLLALGKRQASLYLVTADQTHLVQRVTFALPPVKQLSGERNNRHLLADKIRILRQKDIKENMEQLNRKLQTRWLSERIPLILAGAHHHQLAFRNACSYFNLLERGINCNVDYHDKDELTNLSLEVMESYFEEQETLSVATFNKAEASNLTTTDIEEIARAAANGQVQSLLVAEDRHIWGHLDRDTGEIQIVDHSEQTTVDDLLDDLAELTLNKGGEVTVLPSKKMPKNLMIAAVLRWRNNPSTMGNMHQLHLDTWHYQPGARQELRA